MTPVTKRIKQYIEAYHGKNATSFRARTRITQHGKVVEEHSKTFSCKNDAYKWNVTIRFNFDEGLPLEPIVGCSKTVLQLFNAYKSAKGESLKESETTLINTTSKTAIAQVKVKDLTPNHIYQLAIELSQKKGRGPATVAWYLSILSSVLDSAYTVTNIKASNACVLEARKTLRKDKLIDVSSVRDRKVTKEEYKKILNKCIKFEKSPRVKIPYSKILKFAISQGSRRGQIGRFQQADILEDGKIIKLTRHQNRKDNKEGRDLLAVTPVARSLIESLPITTGKIFPYNMNSVSSGFRRIFKALKIDDLQFRDFRTTLITELDDKGFTCAEISKVSGHSENSRVMRKHYIHKDLKTVADKLEKQFNASAANDDFFDEEDEK
ncbi:tyrosine-type recombinase/integrase [Thalassomonas sp. M1454]|uniref:tyrosine-type recombinase/integrase n=1 Tax=Thalassomonas sp. M1454 TaxID=2594477 RepID=UPI00117F60E2|nr:tyrosine-type recombinase/integrase [Thalassomonas sp. M1454]TRX53474.1 tyrosine-type recombinase/integrase [Thalassomonas sp. M1454]